MILYRDVPSASRGREGKKNFCFDEVQLSMDPAGRYDSEVRKKSGRAEKREGAAARRARRGGGSE